MCGPERAGESDLKVTDKGFWTPAMLALVLSDGCHQVFRETVLVNQHEIPTPATTNRFKLTMSNGDSFWVTVEPDAPEREEETLEGWKCSAGFAPR